MQMSICWTVALTQQLLDTFGSSFDQGLFQIMQVGIMEPTTLSSLEEEEE